MTRDLKWLGRGGGGRENVLLGILDADVPPGSPNPDSISDQNTSFFTPVFRLGLWKIMHVIFTYFNSLLEMKLRIIPFIHTRCFLAINDSTPKRLYPPIRGDLRQYSDSNSIMKNLQFPVPSSEPKLYQQNRNWEVRSQNRNWTNRTEITKLEVKLNQQNRNWTSRTESTKSEQKLNQQNRNQEVRTESNKSEPKSN